MYSCVLQNENILKSTKNKSNIIYFSKFVFLYSLSIQLIQQLNNIIINK